MGFFNDGINENLNDDVQDDVHDKVYNDEKKMNGMYDVLEDFNYMTTFRSLSVILSILHNPNGKVKKDDYDNIPW